MRRSALLLLGLFALASCSGGGSRTPPSAALAPEDAGLNEDGGAAKGDAKGAAASPTSALAIEGETAPEGADVPPLRDDEEPSTYAPDPEQEAETAAGEGPGCSLTQRHMAETQDAILASAKQRAPTTSAAPRSAAHGPGRTPPARLDLVKARFGLTAPEISALERRGFVVPARLTLPSYAVAYHEIYQSELPIYVTVDSIFHAVFATNDDIVEAVEGRRLAPLAEAALRKLHGALGAAARDYPPEVAADLDVYLSVARSLLAGAYVDGALGPRAEARSLIASAMKADAMQTVELFGRARVIDFSQYKPRGHYAKNRRLARYFRASMWLSRLELNLASRSCRSSQPGFVPDPTETPREAALALALADLAERSGATAEIGLLDAAWGLFAGPREDVPLAKIAELRRKAGISSLTAPDAPARLRAAIGDDYQRTARIHYMPEGSTALPAITTLLGPRVVADAAAARPLVNGETPDRYDLSAADMAYAFGHDRAKRYLAADLARFPSLSTQLDKARAAVASVKPAGSDLYSAWLTAVRALSEAPKGALPSFMGGEAFQDLRLASFVAAYGQLKHNNVLLAGQPYDEGACAVPDGFVEPAPGVYRALAEYAERGRAAMASLDPKGALGSAAYFRRLAKIMRVLEAISEAELRGEALSKEALAFLSMVVEIHGVDIGTGFSTTYNGWYFDLFLERPYGTTEPPPGRMDHPSMKDTSFISDYYTSSNTQTAAYAGARTPRLGVFVVDVGGGPRVVVGPVAHAYEHHGPLSARLTDEASTKLTSLTEPWSESYVIPAPPEPPFIVDVEAKYDAPVDEIADKKSRPLDVRLRSSRSLGPVTIDMLDHNRRKVASMTKPVGASEVTFSFRSRPQRVLPGTRAAEMMKITVGDFQAWVNLLSDAMPRGFGGMKPPDPNP